MPLYPPPLYYPSISGFRVQRSTLEQICNSLPVRHGIARGGFLPEDGFVQAVLAGGNGEDLALVRVPAHQAVHGDLLLLPDAVAARHRLQVVLQQKPAEQVSGRGLGLGFARYGEDLCECVCIFGRSCGGIRIGLVAGLCNSAFEVIAMWQRCLISLWTAQMLTIQSNESTEKIVQPAF